MSEVTELIQELRDGTKTLDEVAQRFRERTWPRKPERERGYEALAKAELEDPDPTVEEGSFEEVYSAYMQDQLSRDEYATLLEAAGEAMDAQKDGSEKG